MSRFKLQSPYRPTGDQPQAIDVLTRGIESSKRFQTLLGVTGSGKTFTIANVITRCDMPALIISHNKTLAAQLYGELKNLFPENAVEYFISYYDYYQPEAFVPATDTYIEKDASINEDIDRLRLRTTGSLMTRRDVIVVASVSCIYGLGSPEEFRNMTFTVAEDVAGTYAVSVDDLSGAFVVSAAAPPSPLPPPTPEPTPAPAKPINWWIIGGIVAAVVALLVFVWQTVMHRRT